MARILLIDDDGDLSHFLQNRLEEHGHQIQILERAEPAPDLLRGGGFDLVLLDNKMPGMTGIEFLEALRERRLRLPVILMTGHATDDIAIQATKLGASDYVVKPDDYEQLVHSLNDLIGEALKRARPPVEVPVFEDVPDGSTGPALVGKSPPMVEVYKLIGRFADSRGTVLILGESGTGKDLVAQKIHANSPRKNEPFVALNCAGLPETMLHSELFGHEKGAFTGADKLRKGCFEYANGGTIFLDEVGEMPLNFQIQLLRVLENREIQRLGSNEKIPVNVRVVSATNKNLELAIKEGEFRQDLFFRINQLTIHMPPLRERGTDLELLARFFLARAARDAGKEPPVLSETVLARLRAFSWPGNVRELQNVMYRAFAVCWGSEILPGHLGIAPEEATSSAAVPDETDGVGDLQRLIRWAWDSGQPRVYDLLHGLLERELLKFAHTQLGSNTEVAERLGMARGTVIKGRKKHGLKK